MLRILIFVVSACIPVIAQRSAYIHGAVVDLHDAVMVSEQVSVVSDGFRCETKTDLTGRFNCEVPPGEYVVSAKGFWMLPYERAPVVLKSGDHVFLKLWTVPAPERGLVVDETGAHEFVGQPIPVKHYRGRGEESSWVVIRYISMNQSASEQRFTGPYLMLTSNALTVLADTLVCTLPLRSCVASGSVHIEQNEEVLDGNSAEIDLVTRSFVLTRDAEVRRPF